MPSHGASATVIYTEAGKTFILGCGHAFEGKDRNKPIRIDGPGAPRGKATLAAVDYDLDLSLIRVEAGPVPYQAPAAGRGFQRSAQLLSVGFDEMRRPATQRRATILKETGEIAWTQEPPWHGRSGGALLDMQYGQLVGVVSGYVRYPQGPGVYVSHEAICAFLERHGWTSGKRQGDRESWRQGDRQRESNVPFSRSPCLPFSLPPGLPLSLPPCPPLH
jgi:hypothetical protein